MGCDEVCLSEALPDVGPNGVVFHDGKGYYYTYKSHQFLPSPSGRGLECVHPDCDVTASMAAGMGSALIETSSHSHPPDPTYKDKCLLLHTIRHRFLHDISPAFNILQDIMSSQREIVTKEKASPCLESFLEVEEGPLIGFVKVEPLEPCHDDENDTYQFDETPQIEMDPISHGEKNHLQLQPKITTNLLEPNIISPLEILSSTSQSSTQTHVEHGTHSEIAFSSTSVPSTSTSIKREPDEDSEDNMLEDYLASHTAENESSETKKHAVKRRLKDEEKEVPETSGKKVPMKNYDEEAMTHVISLEAAKILSATEGGSIWKTPRELDQFSYNPSRTRRLIQHMPLTVDLVQHTCQFPGCTNITCCIKCSSCDVFLCLDREKNCFKLFHELALFEAS